MKVNNQNEVIATSQHVSPHLTVPPRRGPGLCERCHTWNDSEPDFECSNCADVRETLGMEPLPTSVVSIYRKPSALRDWLTQYKGRSDDSEPFVPAYMSIVTALLGRFFLEHGETLINISKGYDAVAIVPSTSRAAPHPLDLIVSDTLSGLPLLQPLMRGPGDLGFRRPAKNGYVVPRKLKASARLLLIDDVYTTGARLNSAAFALREAGFSVVGGFVIARRVNIDFDPKAKALWEKQSAEEFQWRSSPIIDAVG